MNLLKRILTLSAISLALFAGAPALAAPGGGNPNPGVPTDKTPTHPAPYPHWDGPIGYLVWDHKISKKEDKRTQKIIDDKGLGDAIILAPRDRSSWIGRFSLWTERKDIDTSKMTDQDMPALIVSGAKTWLKGKHTDGEISDYIDASLKAYYENEKSKSGGSK